MPSRSAVGRPVWYCSAHTEQVSVLDNAGRNLWTLICLLSCPYPSADNTTFVLFEERAFPEARGHAQTPESPCETRDDAHMAKTILAHFSSQLPSCWFPSSSQGLHEAHTWAILGAMGTALSILLAQVGYLCRPEQKHCFQDHTEVEADEQSPQTTLPCFF